MSVISPLRRRARILACLVAALAALLVVASAAGASSTLWAVGDGGVTDSSDDVLADYIQSQGAFDRFLYLGDIYETGTAAEWANQYGPSFGRFKSITSPAPGNHDWANFASGYDPYFGPRAPQQPGGGHYYSFDLPDRWHVISLNAEEDTSATSAQVAWLKQDLAAHPGTCTMAYWHEPRYTATFSEYPQYEPLWEALSGRAVAVLNAHHHNYQRFQPNRGITEFIAGTGGREHHPINLADPRLAAANETAAGALKLVTSPGQLGFSFQTTAGASIDSGSIPCTPANQPPTSSFTYAPSAPQRNEKVTFSSTSSDADGTIASQSWDLNGDGVFGDATGPSASTSFATTGPHTVRLRVTDDFGASTVSSKTVDVANRPPSPSFTFSPAYPLRDQTVTFTSTSSDADGRIVSQAWDLDDDGRFDDGSGTSARTSYHAAGTHTVRLRVTDDDGSSSIAMQVVTVYKRAPQVVGASWARVRFNGLRGARLDRGPKVLAGSVPEVRPPVGLTLVRRVSGLCQAFDGRGFGRASCRTRLTFAARGVRGWSFRLPARLPGGRYRLTVTRHVKPGEGAQDAQLQRLSRVTTRFSVR